MYDDEVSYPTAFAQSWYEVGFLSSLRHDTKRVALFLGHSSHGFFTLGPNNRTLVDDHGVDGERPITVKKEVLDWLDENEIKFHITTKRSYSNATIRLPVIILKDDDAILFKLRWG